MAVTTYRVHVAGGDVQGPPIDKMAVQLGTTCDKDTVRDGH